MWKPSSLSAAVALPGEGGVGLSTGGAGSSAKRKRAGGGMGASTPGWEG